ncbi:hypothetical protein CLOM_g2191 [Closterium sp. NIES-68]|nr:hypothetical protein CLOM_g2191 [Closterium sp. NIES-68]
MSVGKGEGEEEEVREEEEEEDEEDAGEEEGEEGEEEEEEGEEGEEEEEGEEGEEGGGEGREEDLGELMISGAPRFEPARPANGSRRNTITSFQLPSSSTLHPPPTRHDIIFPFGACIQLEVSRDWALQHTVVSPA